MVQPLALYERSDSEFTPNGTTTGVQSAPKITWISSSQYILLWTDDPLDGGISNPQIRAQIRNSDGTAAGAEFTVNLSDVDIQTNAVVARLAGGGFVVAWEDRNAVVDGSGASIRYQVFEADGDRVGLERTANATTQSDQSRPSIAGLEGGGFVITWTDASMTGGDTAGLAVRGQLFSADGNVQGGEFLVNSIVTRDQTASSVVGLPGGGFAVVWQDNSPQDSIQGFGNHYDLGSDIALQIFDSSANKVGGQQVVDDVTPPLTSVSAAGWVTATNPVATLLPDGKIAIAWIDDYGGYAKTRLMNSNGTPAASVVNLGEAFTSTGSAPAIAVLADGGYAISWTAHRYGPPDTSGLGVLARLMRADGSVQGTEFQVNSTVAGDQAAPAMLGFADGGFLVAWQDSGTTDLSAQLFRVDSGAISDIALSVSSISRAGIENVQAAILSADGALNAPFTYELVSDPTGAFRIEGDRLVVADAELLFRYGPDEAVITFRATDPNGNSYDEAIHIPLTDAPAGAVYAAGTQYVVTVQSNQAAAARPPEIVALPDGGYFLTWAENRASTGSYEVMGQINSADGSHGLPFIVNTATPGTQFDSTPVVLENGNILVTWTGPSSPTGGNDILGQILSPSGAKVGAEFLVNTVTAAAQNRAVPTALAGGGFLITWVDASATDDPSNLGVKAQFFDSAGAKSGGELLVNVTTSGAQTTPYAAQLQSGTVVIAWADSSATGGDTSGSAIRARLYSAGGTPIGGEFLVNTTTLYNQSAPVVTALADGRFVIVWGDTSEGTGSTGAFDPADIRAQIFDSAGNKVGAEILVNSETFGFQGQGSLGIAGVAADSSGGFVVTWGSLAQINSDGSLIAVKAQLFGPDGSKSGGEFLVNEVGEGQQSAPAVAFLADNDLVFAWWDVPRTGFNWGIGARRFDAALQSSLGAIEGTPGPDTLFGTAGDDTVSGLDGNDLLRLEGGGDDTANGGAGNDILYFGSAFTGADIANGGDGRDVLVLQGNYTLTLSATNIANLESISLQSGARTTWGDTANNFYDYSITMVDANVTAGQQLIVNGQSLRSGEDFTFDGSAETGDGKFLVYGGNGVDHFTGGSGNDVFFFEGDRWGSSDTVNGGAGRDALIISSGTGLAHIEFGATSLTSIESISVNARFATDPSARPSYELVLNNGNVAPGAVLILNASSLTDPIQTVLFDGSAVHDGQLILFGGAGSDVLIGSDGPDRFEGRLGGDRLTGGAGADTFRYTSVSDSDSAAPDQILDFASGSDKIDLSAIDADGFTGGDQAFHWIGSEAFSAQGSASAGELRAWLYDGSWYVEGDTNGDGFADLVIKVTMPAAPVVESDFLL